MKNMDGWLQQTIKDAEDYVKKNWDSSLGPIGSIQINPCLAAQCDALKSFQRGVQLAGGRLHGIFGWHGTGTKEAVLGICHGNLDVKRRSGQAYGPGEYFGVTTNARRTSVTFKPSQSKNQPKF
jgi:hypothetical protein